MSDDLYQRPHLYDAQYARYRDDLPFYRRLVDDYGGPVLELGAGSGRVTAALAADADVVAVEPSAPMRARAAQRLRQAGVAERVSLIDGDMRTLELDARGFALIVAPFNALMHLSGLADQDAALRRARDHLASGGAFAADVYVPRFGPMGLLRREAEWSEVGGERGELWLWQRHDAAAQIVESHYLLDRTGPDGVVTRERARLVQRYYHRFELVRALQGAGFANVRLFGDFGRGPLREDSEVMVALASG